jgi:hypothetical protein
MKPAMLTSFISLFLLSVPVLIHAQSNDKKAAQEARVQQWVEKKSFVFKATTLLPTGFRSRQLDPGYQISINPGKLVSALPYVGRSTNIIPGSTDGGMNFTSTDFTIESRAGKKGSWTLTVKPKDVTDVRTIVFLISASGNTTVTITSNSRSSVSYNGFLEESK